LTPTFLPDRPSDGNAAPGVAALAGGRPDARALDPPSFGAEVSWISIKTLAVQISAFRAHETVGKGSLA
jgi:hypothetical protein